ncbi:MAG: M14 family zinc carboxypeptidase, partial [Promethearchaeota archaeon]
MNLQIVQEIFPETIFLLMEDHMDLFITFPEWVELEIIGQSYFNRSIWCVHVTDESITENKENILIVGQHHAREQITVEQ